MHIDSSAGATKDSGTDMQLPASDTSDETLFAARPFPRNVCLAVLVGIKVSPEKAKDIRKNAGNNSIIYHSGQFHHVDDTTHCANYARRMSTLLTSNDKPSLKLMRPTTSK